MRAAGVTPSTSPGDRRFFLVAAMAVGLIALAGFGSDIVARHVWFTDFPWPVHVHAVMFSTWIALYLFQTWLVATRNNLTLHRKLGWLGAALAFLMVPLGIGGTIFAIARGSVTGVFPLGLFLTMNTLGISGFGLLTFAAIRLRHHAGWHKRLMLSGTVLLLGPALGRIAATLAFGDLTPFVVIAATLLFFVAGMVFDRMTFRRVHPAYWWGLLSVMLIQLITAPIGFSAPVVAFATGLAG